MSASTGRLAGKTVLITAAAQGIGRASTELFAREGARVIATDISKTHLDELASIAGVETHLLDVTDDAAIKALVAKVGSVDVLFNCAGYVAAGNILECDDKAWDFSFNLNAKAMFHTIRAVLPGMLAKKAGSIVNIASAASSVKGVANRFAYGASKAAVVGLTKSVALEVARTAIRGLDTRQAAAIVRAAVAREAEAALAGVHFLKPGALPKTSSGKVQRSRCRALFLAGDLAMIGLDRQT